MGFAAGFSAGFNAIEGAKRTVALQQEAEERRLAAEEERAERDRERSLRAETAAAMATQAPQSGYTVEGADSPFYRTQEGAAEAEQMARIRDFDPAASKPAGSAASLAAAMVPADTAYDSAMPRTQPAPAAAGLPTGTQPKAAFDVGGKQYADRSAADLAARVTNTTPARLRRAAEVQAKYGEVGKSLEMERLAKTYAKEGVVEALNHGLATGDWKGAANIYQSSGDMRLDGELKAEPMMRQGADGTQIQDYMLTVVKPDGTVQNWGSAFDQLYKAHGIEEYMAQQRAEAEGARGQSTEQRAVEEAGRKKELHPHQMALVAAQARAADAGKPVAPLVLGTGQVAYDPQGNVLARGPDRAPNDAAAWVHDKDNNRMVNKLTGEARALPPGAAAATANPAADRAQMAAKLGVPAASVDPFAGMSEKGVEKMRQSLYEKATKRVDDDGGEAQNEAALAQAAKRFLDLQKQMGASALQQGPLVGRLPGVTDTAQEMDAISSKIVPQMRVPGSGTTSDKDLTVFTKATIGRDKNQAVNEAIAQGLIARGEVAQQRNQFLRDYLTVNGHLDGADREWKRYVNANPIFDPNSSEVPKLNGARQSYQQFFNAQSRTTNKTEGAAGARPVPKPGSVMNGYRFKGGNPNDPSAWARVS